MTDMFQFLNLQETKKKRKILMLSDHPLSTSGVGVQARFLITGLINTGRYSFRCLGGAVKHSDYRLHKVNDDFLIKPIDGFGDVHNIRHLLVSERPDAIMLFTDPRFFQHIWFMEDEIHQICPVTYWNLWDNSSLGTAPSYNKHIYESCDLLNCINYPTYEFLRDWFPERTNYVPHAAPPEVYHKLPESAVKAIRRESLAGREDHFVLLFVSRNARRKNPSDLLASFKLFLEDLQKKHGHRKASLLMHCDPHDPEGPNLITVANMLGINNDVVFSKDRIDFGGMNAVYNVADCLINISSAEGFGLPVLEAKMCEKPIIAIKTGGLTRQVEDHETGFQYGVALEPDLKTLVGQQAIPFIYDDYCTHQTIAAAMMKVYEMGPEKRAEIGVECRKHALKNYDMNTIVKQWDETLTRTIESWKEKKLPNNKRWKHVEL